LDFYLVSHTHWDREWYRAAEVFRQRLVDLIDDLVDHPPADGEAFLLDGQAIVIEDYLAVSPSRRDQLAALVRAGRIEAGPWYVLADELIPGGEALVRNLLLGRHTLASLGATSPPVLYCPDSFGHPAVLPELASGFGLPMIIVWRGYGGSRWPSGDVVRWVGPSGAEAIVYHLPPDGYEFGSSLPNSPDAAALRWKHIRETFAARASLGVALIQNGADHHARQANRDAAVARLSQLAKESGDRVHVASLRSFADALLARAKAQRLPAVSGELRDSYGYTWTLQGTFATRAAQKRANAVAERALGRAEAWAAMARLAGGPSRVDHFRAAWRLLLEAHPHDTLCGTSIDEVAAAADVRMRAAPLQAEFLAMAAMERLVGHDASRAREESLPTRDLIVIENGVPYARGGVAIIEYVEKLADEPVGPGSGDGPRLATVSEAAGEEPRLPKGVQLLQSRIARSRVEADRHYPDNDIARISTVATYVGSQPGMSLSASEAIPHESARTSTVRVGRDGIQCGNLRLGFDKGGHVSLAAAAAEMADVLRFEDRADEGDLYTPSIRAEVGKPRMAKQRISHRGPLVGELVQHWLIERAGEKRGAPSADCELAWRVIADSPLVELTVRGTNRSANHRLRIGFATRIPHARAMVCADAAFGPIERKPLVVPDEDRRREAPPETAPLHRYVSIFSRNEGVTIHSDGLAEYEVDEEGVVWITLVRAVGELSRNDLPERPGHAGWPEDTPGAQCFGPFEARFAIHAHGPMSVATVETIRRESERFLVPLRGFTLRGASTAVRSAGGIELSGAGLAASAIKETEDGRSVVLRCVNLSDRDQKGAWSIPVAIASASLARLDETELGAIPVSVVDGRWVVAFDAGPRAVVTVVVRR
jgi:alpha-mannosidase